MGCDYDYSAEEDSNRRYRISQYGRDLRHGRVEIPSYMLKVLERQNELLIEMMEWVSVRDSLKSAAKEAAQHIQMHKDYHEDKVKK